MGQFIDLKGERFGRLLVTKLAGRKRVRWHCQCDCGTKLVVLALGLRKGTQSCGCLHRERASEANATHRRTRTPEHRAWQAMKTRCTNKNQRQWKDYGGRGIEVCQEWSDSFEAFYEHVGPKPSLDHTIDRIDNLKGYEPGNVRWATRDEQQANKRTSRLLTFDGKTQTMAAWAKQTGLGAALNRRLELGWSEEEALSTPKGVKRK